MIKTIFCIALASVIFSISLYSQTSIAVIPFTGLTEREGNTLANITGTELRNLDSSFVIAPRTSAINTALQEQEIQRKGFTDAETISELGKGANADFVVSGHVQKLGDIKLVSVSLFDVETFQQISGDYIEYYTIDSVIEYMPMLAKSLVSKLNSEYKSLPILAVLPFEADQEASESERDVLAQLLAIQLANSEKYAVVSRTSATNAVMSEHNVQRSGLTDNATIAKLGKALNADYVLFGNVTKLANSGYIEANIVNVENVTLEKGAYKQYRKIEDGVKALADISYELTGVKSLSGHIVHEIIPSIATGVTTLQGVQLEEISLRDAFRKYGSQTGIGEIQSLIKKSIDEKNYDGETPLMIASMEGYTDVVIALILEGADVNLQEGKNDDGITALTYASWFGHSDIVDILLSSHADPNLTGDYGNNYGDFHPLLFAVSEGHNEIVKSLIKYGADVNIFGNYYWSGYSLKNIPLTLAVEKKNIEALRLLIDAGAELDKVNRNGDTALIEAVGKYPAANKRIQLEMVELLLSSGADPNKKLDISPYKGLTALMQAVKSDQIEIISLLLEYNALINITSSNGDTALDFYRGHANTEEVLEVLDEAGALYGWEL